MKIASIVGWVRASSGPLAVSLLTMACVSAPAWSQDPSRQWRQPGEARTVAYADPAAPEAAAPRQPITKVTEGPANLPNDAGQVWREYDISPFVGRANWTAKPEQAVVDWVLRETGYEAWHSEPVGLLTANRQSLRAYHTPDVQKVVLDTVDRFVNPDAQGHVFGIRAVTIENPNWRASAVRFLEPLPVQTPGAHAWMMAKEDAAMLVAELRRRPDYREHSSPTMLIAHGQNGMVSVTRPRTFTRNVHMRPDVYPGFQVEPGQLAEGFTVEMLPLLSIDGKSVDAVLRCRIDQLEKLMPVPLEIPTPTNPGQRVRVDVPQISQCRVEERFRWPVEKVLLVALGVVPTPMGTNTLSLAAGPSRADLLLVIENRGQGPAVQPVGQATHAPGDYRGRY